MSRWWFQIFVYVNHYLGKIPMLTSIFFNWVGWNHQPDIVHRWISTGGTATSLPVIFFSANFRKAIIVDHRMILIEPMLHFGNVFDLWCIYIYIHFVSYVLYPITICCVLHCKPFYGSVFLCLQKISQGASDESDPPARQNRAPFTFPGRVYYWRNKAYSPDVSKN